MILGQEERLLLLLRLLTFVHCAARVADPLFARHLLSKRYPQQ